MSKIQEKKTPIANNNTETPPTPSINSIPGPQYAPGMGGKVNNNNKRRQKAPETIIATDFKTHVLGHFFNQDQTLYNEKNSNSGGAKDPNQPLPPRESLTAQTISQPRSVVRRSLRRLHFLWDFSSQKVVEQNISSCLISQKPSYNNHKEQGHYQLKVSLQPRFAVRALRSWRQVVVVVVVVHSSGDK